MKKEIKIEMLNIALIASIFVGGVVVEHYYDHKPLRNTVVTSDGEILKEIIDYRNGSYKETVPAEVFVDANGEETYYAPAGYSLTMDETGKYVCVRTYTEDTKMR